MLSSCPVCLCVHGRSHHHRFRHRKERAIPGSALTHQLLLLRHPLIILSGCFCSSQGPGTSASWPPHQPPSLTPTLFHSVNHPDSVPPPVPASRQPHSPPLLSAITSSSPLPAEHHQHVVCCTRPSIPQKPRSVPKQTPKCYTEPVSLSL